MSRKRRFATAIVLAAALVVGAVALWPSPQAPPNLSRVLNTEGFKQVKAGMSRAEVEHLLGGPPGYYGQIPQGEQMSMQTSEGHVPPPFASKHSWCDDRNKFEIYFDPDDRVVAAYKRISYRVERYTGGSGGFFRRLLRTLGL